jgi:hypothetical protein
MVWVVGLWLGACSAHRDVPLKLVPRWGVALSAAICIFFIGIRYSWLGQHLTEQSLGPLLDKWQIGPLRVLNIAAFLVVFYWLRKYIRVAVAREPFLTFGKASLQVFCAHLLFVFAGLALLVGEMEQLTGWTAIALLAVTFVSLFLVAANEVRKKRRAKQGSTKPPAPDASAQSPLAPPASSPPIAAVALEERPL